MLAPITAFFKNSVSCRRSLTEPSQPTELPMLTEETKSPFPFLKGEDDEAVTQVHYIITNFQTNASRADQAIKPWLSECNQLYYEIFKDELKMRVPKELFKLLPQERRNVIDWIKKHYIVNTSVQIEENSLEEILELAQKILETYKQQMCSETDGRIDNTGQSKPVILSSDSQVVEEIKAPSEIREGSTSSTNSGGFEKIELKEYAENEPAEDEVSSLESQNSLQSDGTYVDASMNIHQPSTDETLATIKPNVQHEPAQPEPSKRNVYPSSPSEHLPRQVPRKEASSHDYGNHMANVPQQSAQEPNRDNVQSQMENGYNPTSSLVPPVSSAQKLDMSEYTDSLNVMLIGQTGVGKTTFINAFQNYLKYPSLDDALTGGLIVPIRTSFNMVIERGANPVNIEIQPLSCKVAEIVNEPFHSKDGQSRTQNAMIHEFHYTCHDQQRIIRLVDTPGVMDTRGDEKDKENYCNTMETIKRLKHIHAIFVLMKPNEGRFTSEFSSALDKIFKYLPKTAVQNVAFCFTSTEPFNFLPSETFGVLEGYLKELQKRTSVKIRAKKENIFCFDNDCFRFQCTVYQYPQYAEKKSAYERSWNNNTIQLQRMLEYLQSQAPYPALDSVNIARVERRLRNLVETFANITRDHLKEVILIKAKRKASSGWSKILSADSQEIEEREKCFKHILKCCTFFTEFLQRSSVGIEDLFGIQLQKFILTEEKRYELERSRKYPTVAETHALVMELKRIANEYRFLNVEFKTKVSNKSTGAATPEEIETMLNKICQLRYYGDRVATTEAMLLNPGSFRTSHV